MASPDFNVVIQRKAPEGTELGKNPNPYVQIGVAFESTGPGKRSIGLKLNDGIVLDWRMQETHSIRLYVNEKVPF